MFIAQGQGRKGSGGGGESDFNWDSWDIYHKSDGAWVEPSGQVCDHKDRAGLSKRKSSMQIKEHRQPCTFMGNTQGLIGGMQGRSSPKLEKKIGDLPWDLAMLRNLELTQLQWKEF